MESGLSWICANHELEIIPPISLTDIQAERGKQNLNVLSGHIAPVLQQEVAY
ncbi:MAG: hypothetical protein QG599_873 [Pseudomonadota bacterium]|nr:hypothetical protein [Pseudomonadota bacterium]